MVEKLVSQIVDLLKGVFAAAAVSPEQIVVGPLCQPASSQLPIVAVFSGDVVVKQTVRDEASSQARPLQATEQLPITAALAPQERGLLHTPLRGSVHCELVTDAGLATERRVPLADGADFVVDCERATITVQRGSTGGGLLDVSYSYVGVSTVRELEQELFVETLDVDAEAAERWSSLATAVVLTNHDELIEEYNRADRTTYGVGGFSATHLIAGIEMLGGKPTRDATRTTMRLSFRVRGSLRLTKTVSAEVGILERIRGAAHLADGSAAGEVDVT